MKRSRNINYMVVFSCLLVSLLIPSLFFAGTGGSSNVETLTALGGDSPLSKALNYLKNVQENDGKI
ncbi:MAG: hypothetical protein QXD73_04350, partial [Candidatus Bathyarchaeia archaeon]